MPFRWWARHGPRIRAMLSFATLLVGQLNQHRLMIGGGGFAVYLYAPDTAGDVLGDEDEIPAVRAVFPLHVIMKATGGIVRQVRVADRPRVAVVQSGPR